MAGCLGVTAKSGPLARTDLWAGVKGLLERLMTHLGLGSLLEEPWGGLCGGGGGVVFLGDGAILLGRLGCPVPGGMPMALPDWPSWIAKLTCLGRASGLGNAASFAGKESSGLKTIASFPRRKVSICLGRTASFTRGKVSSCQGRIASFTGRKESNCWRRVKGNAWLRLNACWGWITSFLGRKESNSLGGTASFTWGKESSCRERIASFPGRKVSNCQRRVRGNTWCLTACWVELMAWEGLLTSLEGRIAPAWLLVCDVLLPSLGGKH